MSEHIQEMYSDMYLRRKDLEHELDDTEDGDRREDIMEQLNNIRVALGEEPDYGRDDLIDRWEEQFARGETPDLTEVKHG